MGLEAGTEIDNSLFSSPVNLWRPAHGVGTATVSPGFLTRFLLEIQESMHEFSALLLCHWSGTIEDVRAALARARPQKGGTGIARVVRGGALRLSSD